LIGLGVPDLVVANKGSNDVSILFGQGQGDSWTLVPGPRLQVGLGPVATAVADVNGNGIPDLLVANSESNNVYLLRGVGDGYFDDAHPTVFQTGADPQQLFVGHFGRGPALDLVTVNAGSNDLTYFPGFGPGRSIASGGLGPTAAAAGDFTRDGRTGLVVLNSLDNHVALLLPGSDGPQIAAVLAPGNLAGLSDLALGRLSGNAVEVYVTAAGQDAVTRLAFSLDLSPAAPPATSPGLAVSLFPGAPGEAGSGLADPALLVGLLTLLAPHAPPAEALLESSPGRQVADFSPLPDLHLGVVVTLLLAPRDGPAAPPPAAPATDEGPSTGALRFAATGVTPPGPEGTALAEEAGTRADGADPAPPAGAALGLNAFLAGSADTPAGRLLSGGGQQGGQPLDLPVPAPELFDFDVAPVRARRVNEGDSVSPSLTRRAPTGAETARQQGAASSPARADAPPGSAGREAAEEGPGVGQESSRGPGWPVPPAASVPPSPAGSAQEAGLLGVDSAWVRGMAVFLAQGILGFAAGDGPLPDEEEEACKR
jgi:hypothetical protein